MAYMQPYTESRTRNLKLYIACMAYRNMYIHVHTLPKYGRSRLKHIRDRRHILAENLAVSDISDL